MASKMYNNARLIINNGVVAWASADLYAILVSSAYTYDATHTTYADVSASEISDTDYSPVDVANASISIVDTDDVLFDCDNISFGSEVTINASGGHMIILAGDEAAPAASDKLMFAVELADPTASSASEFTITTADGVYRVNAGA